jgi:YegS/Rv2252/BmrU family lipid kinase
MNYREKLVVILNGISRKKKKFYQQIVPGLSAQLDVTVWETKHRDHAIDLGREASVLNPIGIFAAGGDGTLNQVLNGMMLNQNSDTLPPIGTIPLGTGNDFARLSHIKPTAESILEKIKIGGKPTDVGVVNCVNEKGEQSNRYFINVASLGMGPAVVRRLFSSDRTLGPSLTYLKAITQTFFTHQPEAIEITTERWTWSGKIRVFAVANGQSFGNALYVGPDAKPDDGLFNTFRAGEIALLKFLWLLQRIKAKDKIKDSCIVYDTCTKLSLKAPQPCWIETEGELAGLLPAKIEILPGVIKFFR